MHVVIACVLYNTYYLEYCNFLLFYTPCSPLSCEDTADDSTSDMGVADDDHTHSTGGGFNVSAAMKLIHNTGSRAVSAKAHHAPKDAYFAFLMLRHLKIREERQKVILLLL